MLGHQTPLRMRPPATALPGSSGHLPWRRKQQSKIYAKRNPLGNSPELHLQVHPSGRWHGWLIPGWRLLTVREYQEHPSPGEGFSANATHRRKAHWGGYLCPDTGMACLQDMYIGDISIFRSTLQVWAENCRFHLAPICAFKAALNTQHELASSFTHRLSRSVF